MDKPTLIVQTIYFHPKDQGPAKSLGDQLYDRLTRPQEDPLSFGAGIPVRIAARWDKVELGIVTNHILVPVLGAESFMDEATRENGLQTIASWRKREGIKVVPVLTSANWCAVEENFKAKSVLKKPDSDDDKSWLRSMIDITLAACRLLGNDQFVLRLFISHARADLKETKNVAEQLRDFASSQTAGDAFFNTTDLVSVDDLEAQLAKAPGTGLFIAVRTDSYASRSWCQRELLWAKQAGIPTLTVEYLKRGEVRSSAYGGNGPTILWEQKPGEIVLRAFIEWLKARHFEIEAPRIAPNIPELVVLPRPPELLDLAQGPLLNKGPSVVIYPDPELSSAEQRVMREARPRMRLITPSGLYRTFLRREQSSSSTKPVARAVAPFSGLQIAMSLSGNSDEESRSKGLADFHLYDATIHLGRALISAGAAIAYGGDFRDGGFDELLSQLVVAYNTSGVETAKFLYSYLAATIPSEKTARLPVTACSLGWTERFVKEARLAPPTGEVTPPEAALYFSDMRRVMADHCFGRIALGGQSWPRSNGGKGYGGMYPGILEEAWRTFEARKPLYIVGGFQGAAGTLAALADENAPLPPALDENTFQAPDYSEYRERVSQIRAHPGFAALGGPRSLSELVISIRTRLKTCLASDESSLQWNGLTRAQNHELFHSADPHAITRLVMTGLFNKALSSSSGKLRIELVNASLAQVEAVDAIAIGAFRNVPIAGAARELDQMLSGRISIALKARESMVSISSAEVDADWVRITDLGEIGLDGVSNVPDLVQRSAEEIAIDAVRHGFKDVAVVTFGSSVVPDLQTVVDRMIKGLSRLVGRTVLHWFEVDPKRFEELRGLLTRPDVALTTRVTARRAATPVRHQDVMVIVRYEKDLLSTTVVPPAGAAAVRTVAGTVPREELRALCLVDAKETPADLVQMGDTLGRLLFEEEGCQLLACFPKSRIIIQHDLESAVIPFECLRAAGESLSLRSVMIRRPSLQGSRSSNVEPRPPRVGQLNLQLVINPTKDLPGAAKEAETVIQMLKGDPHINLLMPLRQENATKAAILQALSNPVVDIFHYCGHAFYEGTGDDQSGLFAANHEKLLARDLLNHEITPRLVFFNACQSARLRNQPTTEASRGFAEFCLRSPIEAYIGSFWPVGDAAAAGFALGVYSDLALGKTLDDAVLLARKNLEVAGHADWANYLLFGDGAFSFIAPEA